MQSECHYESDQYDDRPEHAQERPKVADEWNLVLLRVRKPADNCVINSHEKRRKDELLRVVKHSAELAEDEFSRANIGNEQ